MNSLGRAPTSGLSRRPFFQQLKSRLLLTFWLLTNFIQQSFKKTESVLFFWGGGPMLGTVYSQRNTFLSAKTNFGRAENRTRDDTPDHMPLSLWGLLLCKIFLVRSYKQNKGSSIAQWLAYLLPDPATPGSIPSIRELFFREKIVNVAEVNQQRCLEYLEESGLGLDNIDQSHWLVAS